MHDPHAAAFAPRQALSLLDGRAPALPEELFARLDRLGLAHKTFSHPALFTVEDAKALRVSGDASGDISGQVLPEEGGHVKNLFLRNKKGQLWLVTCAEDRPLDLKMLGEILGSGRLSFASAERLGRYLGILPGAVSPFALLNDHSGAVSFYLDENLLKEQLLYLHPLVNTMTTALSPQGLLQFLETTAHAAQFF